MAERARFADFREAFAWVLGGFDPHPGRYGPFAVLATALALSACSSDVEVPNHRLEPGQTLVLLALQGRANARVRIDGNELVEGKNAFLVDFDSSSVTLTGANALMPAHGHGMPKAPKIDETASGYRVSNMIFSMPGLWEVIFYVEAAEVDGQLELSVDVP